MSFTIARQLGSDCHVENYRHAITWKLSLRTNGSDCRIHRDNFGMAGIWAVVNDFCWGPSSVSCLASYLVMLGLCRRDCCQFHLFPNLDDFVIFDNLKSLLSQRWSLNFPSLPNLRDHRFWKFHLDFFHAILWQVLNSDSPRQQLNLNDLQLKNLLFFACFWDL